MNNINANAGKKPNKESKREKANTLKLVQLALFTAIILIMAFVPYLGYIPLGFMNATIIHIPVIIGALFLGPKAGATLGFVFGLTSLYKNTFSPNLTSFVFSPFYSLGDYQGSFASLIICFVPRILIGILTYYTYKLITKKLANKTGKRTLAFAVSGVVGSMTNTIFVFLGIHIFFGQSFSAANGIAESALYKTILTIIATQSVPEAILAGILVTGIGNVLYRARLGKR